MMTLCPTPALGLGCMLLSPGELYGTNLWGFTWARGALKSPQVLLVCSKVPEPWGSPHPTIVYPVPK